MLQQWMNVSPSESLHDLMRESGAASRSCGLVGVTNLSNTRGDCLGRGRAARPDPAPAIVGASGFTPDHQWQTRSRRCGFHVANR